MKTLLSLLMAAVALVAAHPDYSDTWEEFKQTYSKQYGSEDEEVRPDTLLVSRPDGEIIWLGKQQEASDTILIFYVPSKYILPQPLLTQLVHYNFCSEHETGDMDRQGQHDLWPQ